MYVPEFLPKSNLLLLLNKKPLRIHQNFYPGRLKQVETIGDIISADRQKGFPILLY
jgi:hypothetical protein